MNSPQPTDRNGIGMEYVIVSKGKSWLGGNKDPLGPWCGASVAPREPTLGLRLACVPSGRTSPEAGFRDPARGDW